MDCCSCKSAKIKGLMDSVSPFFPKMKKYLFLCQKNAYDLELAFEHGEQNVHPFALFPELLDKHSVLQKEFVDG